MLMEVHYLRFYYVTEVHHVQQPIWELFNWNLLLWWYSLKYPMLLLFQDADEDSVSQDLAVQRTKIYNIKTTTPEGPDDIGIVVEGVKVLTALGNFPRACSMVVGLAYAVNLAYPKELRYTLEVFQKLLLELDCSKLSPKVNSLKNKLLA